MLAKVQHHVNGQVTCQPKCQSPKSQNDATSIYTTHLCIVAGTELTSVNLVEGRNCQAMKPRPCPSTCIGYNLQFINNTAASPCLSAFLIVLLGIFYPELVRLQSLVRFERATPLPQQVYGPSLHLHQLQETRDRFPAQLRQPDLSPADSASRYQFLSLWARQHAVAHH